MIHTNVRLGLTLAPGLILGTIAVAMADDVPGQWLRFTLLVSAVGSVAAMSWLVGAAALGGTLTRAHGLPERLKNVASDSRRTTFDRDTGLHVEWYFRLRIEEEIARSKRYGQPFTVLSIGASEPLVLDAARIAMRQMLREVDFAGDLGETVALCLPNTSRIAAAVVMDRITRIVHGLEISVSEYPTDGHSISVLLGETHRPARALEGAAA